MLQNAGTDRWRDLIGVSGARVEWDRALVFCVAFVASDFLAYFLWWAMTLRLPRPWWQLWMGYVATGSRFPHWLISIALLSIATACAVAVFRFVPGRILPALASALTYGLVSLLMRAWINPIETVMLPPEIAALPAAIPGAILFALANFSWVFLFLLGVALALRWVKRLWVALLLGGAPAMLLTRTLSFTSWAGSESYYPPIVVRLFDTPYRLLQAALFVGVFLAALQMSRAEKGRLSKRFYLGSILGGWLLGLLLVSFVLLSRDFNRTLFHLSFAWPGVWIVGTYTAVVMGLLIYRMWAAIQDGHARTTPSKAVGFLFIPVFNLYWAFQVFWGFAKDYNSYIKRNALNARGLPTGLFLAYVLLVFLGFVPVVGLLVIAANILVGAVMVAKICDAINTLPATPAAVPIAASDLRSLTSRVVRGVAYGATSASVREPDAVSYCPQCHCSYREGFSVCAECGVPLVKYAA